MPLTITEFCWDEESAMEPTDATDEGKVFVAKMAPTSAVVRPNGPFDSQDGNRHDLYS